MGDGHEFIGMELRVRGHALPEHEIDKESEGLMGKIIIATLLPHRTWEFVARERRGITFNPPTWSTAQLCWRLSFLAEICCLPPAAQQGGALSDATDVTTRSVLTDTTKYLKSSSQMSR